MATAKKKAPSKATQKKPPTKKGIVKPQAAKKAAQPGGKKPRIFAMSFASVYPLYVQKVERKGRTRAEVDQIIAWLTGYRGKSLQRALDRKVDFEAFFAEAPRSTPTPR